LLASHMKRVSSSLVAKGHKVIDQTVPGWAAGKSYVDSSSKQVEPSMQHPTAVGVVDFLSNSSMKNVQDDDSLSGACQLKDG
jgi:hypothetical protein